MSFLPLNNVRGLYNLTSCILKVEETKRQRTRSHNHPILYLIYAIYRSLIQQLTETYQPNATALSTKVSSFINETATQAVESSGSYFLLLGESFLYWYHFFSPTSRWIGLLEQSYSRSCLLFFIYSWHWMWQKICSRSVFELASPLSSF